MPITDDNVDDLPSMTGDEIFVCGGPPLILDSHLRVCYRGVFTLEQAQEKMGDQVVALEVHPATCCGDNDDLVDATEVIFKLVDK